MQTTTHINEQVQQVRQQIQKAEAAFGRAPNSVLLLAVSKTKPALDIALAYRAGQRHFAENYVQEALGKQNELGAYDISWHFIGPIQSNKTKAIATHFSWVHSVDSIKIAQRLNSHRPPHLPRLQICVQVNICDESSKSGCSLGDLSDICEQIVQLPRLTLRGVMAIPEPEQDFTKQREPYRKLRQAVAELEGLRLDTFSFGMTNDLSAAIAEGSTIVRIGTALFGARG